MLKVFTREEWDMEFDRQAKFIYSLIVAGKSANFADKATKAFLEGVAVVTSNFWKGKIEMLPFEMLRTLEPNAIEIILRDTHTGNYGKLVKAITGLLKANFDLRTVTPEQLETIHGFGPKTSRFAVVWIRPEAEYAVLDVHILRWLAEQDYSDVPKHTPQNLKVYSYWEQIFIMEAKKRGKTPRELDREIWEIGAGRTQEKAI